MSKGKIKNALKTVAVTLLTALVLTGCAGRHRITVVSGEKFLESCPKTARAGDTVTVYTLSVTDANMYVNATDLTEVTCVRDGVYRFVMPDHDIELKITVISNGLA